MRLITRYRLTVALLLVLLTLIVCLNGLGDFYTDIKPEVYIAPWEMTGRYLSAWTSSPYLGSPNFNVGLVPVLLLLSAFRGIGLSPEWTFKVFHLLLWVAAAWGTARLVRTIAPKVGRWGALVAAVVYLANPYTIQAGATLAIALPLSLLPWQLLCLVRALRHPRSWAWPAAFGLTFFAMSGMNVAVVPLLQLLAVVPVALAVKAETSISWGRVLRVVAKCALFVLGLSIYWLVPSFAAQATGTQIIDSSETLTGIAKVSSFPEVLRGLGLWPLYGHDDNGPWVPQDAVYVASPLVVLLTMAWPALGLLSLRWATGLVRRIVAGCVALAAVVMVGLFPSETHPASPFGRLLVWLLGLPFMAAFRTTNKIGAVLALALATAIGVGAVRVLPRLWPRPGAKPVVIALTTVLALAWALPAVGGRLYTSRMDIPGYWYYAAKAADQGNPDSTVLLLPGQVRPDYRWTVERPDDVTNSLLKRNAVLPETTPNASPPGVNFLAALDGSVQAGTAPASIVSTMARYLGSDKVLLRRDTVWENNGGARPSQMTELLRNDAGLKLAATFGYPSENVGAPFNDPAGHGEDKLPPLALYDVQFPRTALRAQPTGGQVLVAGDGFAFPAMTRDGLLGAAPTVRYAQDLSARQLAQALPSAGRLVLTDTNARRDVIPNRLTAGQGPLLAGGEPLGDTRTLGTRTADQTVLLRSGTRVTASSTGGTFFDLPYGVPEYAVDGDQSTGWRFGDFRRAPGQTLTVHLPSAMALGRIPVSQLQLGPTKIDKVTLRAGGRSATVRVPDKGSAMLDMGGVTASDETLTIDSIRGEGFNLVGIAELGVPGPKAIRTARTPTTFSDRYQQLDEAQRRQFDRTPLDVLLTRVQNTADPGDDSETTLRRVVTVPDARRYQMTGDVRVAGSLEGAYDASAGYDPQTTVRSSGFYFNNPKWRASQAADGSPTTAWTPGGSVRGSWWEATGPRRSIPSVTVNQEQPAGATKHQWASRVQITVDGRLVKTAAIGHGASTIPLPGGTTGSTVRMTIIGVDGDLAAPPPQFSEIDAGVRVRKTTPGPLDSSNKARCLTVATVDGKPVKMRPTSTTIAGAGEEGTSWESCQPLSLARGERRIEQAPGFIIDSLSLKDTQQTTTPQATTPSFTIEHDGSSSKTLTVTGGSGPYAVAIGQSIDPRWHAFADGKDLGAPTTIDGFSTGWIVPDGGTHTITISYGPQRTSNIALVISGLVLAIAVALVTLAAWRRRRRRGRWDDDGDGDGPEAGAPRAATPATPPAGRRASHLSATAAPGSRWQREVGLVVLAGFAIGWAGLVAGLLVVGGLRLRPVRPSWMIYAGSGLVMASIVVYLVLLGGQRGEVSADAVSSSLIPHYLAGAGLVIALVSALLARDHHHQDPDEDMDVPLTLEAPAP